MSDQPFVISTYKHRKLVCITFKQVFWDTDIKRSFIEGCVNAIVSLDCEIGSQAILVDLRTAILQSQDLIASMQKFLSDPSGGRIALVADTPLARMQTKRLQVREDVRMFDDVASAEAWLFSSASAEAA